MSVRMFRIVRRVTWSHRDITYRQDWLYQNEKAYKRYWKYHQTAYYLEPGQCVMVGEELLNGEWAEIDRWVNS